MASARKKKNKLGKDERIVSYFLIVLTIVLVVLLGVFIYLYVSKTSVLVAPDRCPYTTGLFGASPSQVGQAGSYCGNNSNGTCIFPNVTSLSSAIDLCLNYPANCKAFSYSSSTNTVYLLNGSALSQSGTFDTYQIQTGLNLT